MRTSLSSKLIREMQLVRTGEVLLTFLDINANGSHLYLVNDTASHAYDGHTYEPFAFQIRRGNDVDGEIPVFSIDLDNTDRTIMTLLDSSPLVRPTVTMYQMLASQIGTLEWPPETYELTDTIENAETISFTLSVGLASDETFPAHTFNPYNYPSLFRNPAVEQEAL